MATCGILVDSKLCIYCKKEQKLKYEEFWIELYKKKKFFFKDKQYAEAFKINMRKQSEYREKAYQEGMLRPFLLLVSMPPSFRLKIANSIGLSCLVCEDFFGDPHHESWHILNSHFYGVQARTHSATKKIFKNTFNHCWYEILRKIIEHIFGVKNFYFFIYFFIFYLI